MIRNPRSRTAVVLAAALFLAGCCRPAMAQESPSPEASARDLAAEVLRKAGDGDLGTWTRSVIDRSLGRAGEAARQTVPGSSRETPAPLPAERHAPSLAAGRANTPEILLFTSLSVPAASWRQWAREAARIGAPLVMRGVAAGSLRATVKRIGDRLGGAEAGVAIDPHLFRLFGVTRVPAVIVVPGGVPACRSPGCSGRSAAAPRPGDGKHRSGGRARSDRRRRQRGARRGEASPRKVEG